MTASRFDRIGSVIDQQFASAQAASRIELAGSTAEGGHVARYLVQFESRAADGADEAFNLWYDGVHVPDVLAVPGFLSCQRYRIVGGPGEPCRYLAAYEIESDDPQATLGTLIQSSGAMEISPALDQSSVKVSILEQVGERRDR
jgi:hypothetical protein